MSQSLFVIVATYNGIRWLDKCFASLRNADHPVKAIAIDNGSTDGTQAAIRSRYPEVELIQAEKNLGFGKANNIGIKRALDMGADFVFLLNQDAYLWKGSLKQLLSCFEKNSNAGIISPVHFAGDERNFDFGFFKYSDPTESPGLLGGILLGEVNRLYESKFVNAAAWIIPSKVIRKIGFFHPVFDHYGEDREYVRRLEKYAFKLFIYPGFSIVHDRPQNRHKNSFFDLGESFKRNLLVDLVSGKISRSEANARYIKVFIDKLLRLRFSHALITAKNWKSLNDKIRRLKV